MKKFLACFFTAFLALCLFACGGGKDESKSVTIIFEGAGSFTITSNGGSYDLPTVSLNAGETLRGWALKANATTPLVIDEISYDEIVDYITDNKLFLYPVIEKKIELTIHGVTDAVSQLSNVSNNQATLPLVYQNERQQFVGWTNVEGSSNVVFDANASITYQSVQSFAVNAKADLYPVVESYDIMICVHGSHSNGNVYVTPEQRVELRNQLDAYFAGQNLNILIDYVDAVNATNFAAEAVKKDYDIVLTSKTARNSGNNPGDIANAAIAIGKEYYAEADSNETTLSAIELKQSRQVCRFLGSNNEKPYQDALYIFLTTPIDYTVEITFQKGELSETIVAHRVVNDEISTESYEPTNKAIMEKGSASFNGWTTDPNGTEVEFANASYVNVYNVAVDGKVTLYPVFTAEADAYFVVWGINGNNEYVSEEQYNTIKAVFNTYCSEHNIDLAGKNIVIEYFQGKTADFQSKLTLDYVMGAVGAAALSNETYAKYWTIAPEWYGKVVNVQCTNASRYVALRETAADNIYAQAFYRALCESEITVKFAGSEESFVVNSVDKNVVELPSSITVPQGKFLAGYGLTSDDTQATITGSITYESVSAHAANGEITLYPIFASYDLVVYVWLGQSKTGTNIYVTEEECEQLKADFITYLGSKANGKQIVFNGVWGKTANYGALVGSEADVIVSGPNLNNEAQCGALLDSTYGKIEVINYSFASGSTRYAGLCSKAVNSDLAIEFVKYLCEAELTVTFDGGQPQTINRVFGTTSLVIPSVTLAENEQLIGFATTENAESAEFDKENITFDQLRAKAVNGSITLYPVITTVAGKIKVTVGYHEYGSATTTPYFTQEMLETLQGLVASRLTQEGYTSDQYEITWTSYNGKVAGASAAITADGVDVAIAHTQVFDSGKTTTPFVCAENYPAVVFTSKTEGATFYCASNLKVGVSTSAGTNVIAGIIYNILASYAA